MPRSYKRVTGQEMASLRENTILSFTNAGSAGADYVELDGALNTSSLSPSHEMSLTSYRPNIHQRTFFMLGNAH